MEVIDTENLEMKNIDKSEITYSHQDRKKDWEESTTIKYKGNSVAEIQIHNNRNCVKTRFHMKYFF
ncbi:hypothetical protein EBU94_04870 [bacterium]|nr:hypothetical protein [bacterium]